MKKGRDLIYWYKIKKDAFYKEIFPVLSGGLHILDQFSIANKIKICFYVLKISVDCFGCWLDVLNFFYFLNLNFRTNI